jgi:hypothetical protein
MPPYHTSYLLCLYSGSKHKLEQLVLALQLFELVRQGYSILTRHKHECACSRTHSCSYKKVKPSHYMPSRHRGEVEV